MSKTLPSLAAIKLISWLYVNISLARLIRWGAAKVDGASNSAAVLTDYFVVARLLTGLLVLIGPFHPGVTILAVFVLYDVLIAHAAHLFDPNVGSGGAGKRIAAGVAC